MYCLFCFYLSFFHWRIVLFFQIFSAVRKELARRGQGDSDTMKAKMAGAMAELDKHKNDQKDITAGKSIRVLCCESSFILSVMFLVIINTKKQVIPLKKV